MTKHNKYYWDLDRNKPYKDYLGSSDKNNEELNNKREMKQTAVEFLQECLSIHLNHKQQIQFEGLFQQAKAMHKEEIEEAWNSAYGGDSFHDGEDYYNAKFNTKER
jgi:hypothetical protein